MPDPYLDFFGGYRELLLNIYNIYLMVNFHFTYLKLFLNCSCSEITI